jgi:sarcosine oxidase subunit alpha
MPTIPPPVARTPLHHWHAAHGAHFAEQDGWQVVSRYAPVEQEMEAARAGLGLAEISAWARISLRGPGVQAIVPSLVPNGAVLNPRGVVAVPETSALVCRLTDDHLLLLGSSASIKLGQRLDGLPVVQTDATSAHAAFWVVGPRCEELLCRLTHLDVRAACFPMNTCAETALAGVEALLVRTAELSVPSMRVCVPWDLGEYVWERMMEAGREWDVVPLGLEALGLLGAGKALQVFQQYGP